MHGSGSAKKGYSGSSGDIKGKTQESESSCKKREGAMPLNHKRIGRVEVKKTRQKRRGNDLN